MTTTQIPCRSCGRPVVVEISWVKSAHEEEREFFIWCGRRCQLRYVAERGTAAVLEQLETEHIKELRRAGYSDSDSSSKLEVGPELHRGDRSSRVEDDEKNNYRNGRSDGSRLW